MPDAPSADTLRSQAEAETQQAIDQETGVYRTDIENLQGAEAGALADLDKSYGRVLPYVQQSAQYVGDYYKAGIAQEQSIFDTAIQRLNALRGTQASEAQQLAQATGGPVRLDQFTAPIEWSMKEGPLSAAGSLLRATGLAQGGVQEAAAFSGKVFPLMRIEQAAALRREYEGRIETAQREIDRIKSQGSARTQTRLDQLTQQERQYQLDQDKLALDRLNAERSYALDKQRLAMERARILREKEAAMGYVSGRYRDASGKIHTWRKPTLEKITRDDLERERLRQAGFTQQEIDARMAQLDEDKRHNLRTEALTQAEIDANKIDKKRAYDINRRAIALKQREVAGALIDAATTDTGKPMTVELPVEVPPSVVKDAPPSQRANWIVTDKDPNGVVDGKIHYYQQAKQTIPPNSVVMKHPTDVYYYLIGHGIPKNIAIQSIKARFGLPDDWKPGYTPSHPGPYAGKSDATKK